MSRRSLFLQWLLWLPAVVAPALFLLEGFRAWPFWLWLAGGLLLCFVVAGREAERQKR